MYEKIAKSSITKIAIVKTDCKLTLRQVVDKYSPNYVINGGLYNTNTGKVNNIPLRIDGKTIATSSDGYWMMAWNSGSDICMIHSNDMNKYSYAVACSTMLKDGKETIFTYTKAQGGIRGRTGFGDDNDCVHLFVTTDTSGALKPESLRTKMKYNGCKNAIMLDCGGSSQAYVNGKYYQSENRKVSYWILVWTENECPYKEPTVSVRMNTRGDNAKWVQWHLNQVNSAGLTVDGIFGKNSVAALKEFQRKSGLDDDGICGKLTRVELKKAINSK